MWGVQWCGAAEVSEPVVCTRSQTHCDEHTDVKVADEPSAEDVARVQIFMRLLMKPQ